MNQKPMTMTCSNLSYDFYKALSQNSKN